MLAAFIIYEILIREERNSQPTCILQTKFATSPTCYIFTMGKYYLCVPARATIFKSVKIKLVKEYKV